MRKIVFVLVALLLAVPALGTVRIIANDEGGGKVDISYEVDGGKPRAFALKVTVDSGAVISDVCDYHEGESSSSEGRGYGIFMGTIDIDPNTGDVNGWGNPVAPNDAPGASGTGRGTNTVILGMGSLYGGGQGSENAPNDSGSLCKVIVTSNPNDSNLCITAEEIHRGGVVDEDGSRIAPDLNDACTLVYFGCYPQVSDLNDWSEWDTVGRPPAWCYPRQCHGDADGLEEQITSHSYAWVAYDDLQILLDNWKDKLGETSALPADFDHAKEQITSHSYARVAYDDLAILLANWKDKLGSEPNCLDLTE